MVLEALAAVSLAGNIAQFVAFSCQLFNTATSIQRSATGAAQNIQDVETVTEALRDWCEKLSTPRNTSLQQKALQGHSSLLELAERCHSTADELLSTTERVKAKNPKSEWSSFKAALSSTWSEGRIKDCEKRLDTYRHQMVLEVSMLQRQIAHYDHAGIC